MAKWCDPPHPNVLAAVMAPEARRLAADHIAARRRRTKIAAMHEAGVPVVKIAKKYGISTERVYQLLYRHRHDH